MFKHRRYRIISIWIDSRIRFATISTEKTTVGSLFDEKNDE